MLYFLKVLYAFTPAFHLFKALTSDSFLSVLNSSFILPLIVVKILNSALLFVFTLRYITLRYGTLLHYFYSKYLNFLTRIDALDEIIVIEN